MPEQIPPRRARRMRENEELMESINRRMDDVVGAIRREEGRDPDAPILFFCECAHEDCGERLPVRPARYEAIHADPERFVLVPGHEVPEVELVVERDDDLVVVRKTA